MTRPPPRSTLFPSTPLSRSAPAADRLRAQLRPGHHRRCRPAPRLGCVPSNRGVVMLAAITAVGVVTKGVYGPGRVRSEEHTSELQSQSNLVCRLLLEKKTPS